MSERTGFLEESPGAHSVTRLVMLIIALCVAMLVTSLCAYLLWRTPDKEVIAAVGVIIAGLVLNGIWHAKLRDGGDNTGAPDPATSEKKP